MATDQVTPDAKYDGEPLVTVTLQQCQHCGQMGETERHIPHLGCAKDHEYGAHPAAVVQAIRVQVQVIQDA